MTDTTNDLSFGQKAVGLNFNPSGDDAVGQVKQKIQQETLSNFL